MERVLMGALVGAGVGSMLAGFTGAMKRHREESQRLVYDWRYVKQDPDIAAALHALQSFRHADENEYRQIGEACNMMVMLWFLVQDRASSPQHHWTWKSFQYRRRVESGLVTWSQSLLRASRRLDRSEYDLARMRQQAPADKRTNHSQKEFHPAADTLTNLVRNYHYNIVVALQARLREVPATAEPATAVGAAAPVPDPPAVASAG